MQSLPSYIKDTTDFLSKIKDCKLSGNSYLVTLDVTSLYTNIPHTDGIDACRFFLDKDPQKSNTSLSVGSICKLMELVLKNNHFQFNGVNYIQNMGTAMGSPAAPAFASLFMGKLEQDYLLSRDLTPALWLRFLDDIFMIWNHSLHELEEFIKDLNELHDTIKFTYTISRDHVSFLDVDITKDTNHNLSTTVHVKNTNIHQYLEYTSSHPRTCKDGIPYSQAKRYRRIISDDLKFEESLDDLRDYFRARNYPDSVIDSAFEKARQMTQDDALIYNDQNTENAKVPFVIEYNPSLPNIGNIIHKYWDLFKLSQKDSVKHLHSYKPVLEKP